MTEDYEEEHQQDLLAEEIQKDLYRLVRSKGILSKSYRLIMWEQIRNVAEIEIEKVMKEATQLLRTM